MSALPLPTVTEFSKWMSQLLDLRVDDLSRGVAASNVMVAYARAQARDAGLNEHQACLNALEHLRATKGPEHALQVAETQGMTLPVRADTMRAHSMPWDSKEDRANTRFKLSLVPAPVRESLQKLIDENEAEQRTIEREERDLKGE